MAIEYRYIEVPDNTMRARLSVAAWCQHYDDKVAEIEAIMATNPTRKVAGKSVPYPPRPAEGPIDLWLPDRFFPAGRWWWSTVAARGLRVIDLEDGNGAVVRMPRLPKRGNKSRGEAWKNKDIAIASDADIEKASALTNVRNDPRSIVVLQADDTASFPVDIQLGTRLVDVLSGDVWVSMTRGRLSEPGSSGRFVVRNITNDGELSAAVLSLESPITGVSLSQRSPVPSRSAAHRARALLGKLELDGGGAVDPLGKRLDRSQAFRFSSGDIVTRASVSGRYDAALSDLEAKEEAIRGRRVLDGRG